MNNKRRTILLPLLVGLTLLANLAIPSPVLAAGEPPPPPGEKSPRTQAAPARPAPPAADTGASYTTEIPVTAPVGAPDGAANAAAAALSVETIARAGAVLVGPSGNPLPLAARETLNVLTIGDVYFKGSGGAECSAGWCQYETIASALTSFSARNGSGTIFATGNLSEPGDVNMDGALQNLGKLTRLAWDGTTNYNPQLSGLLFITNMLKGLTLDGFSIFHGIDASGNAGTLRLQNLYVTNPDGDGILVNYHKGNIDLFNVTVASARFDGAFLINESGTWNVTISNSSFNANQDYGLRVVTNGSILLDRVEANGNQSHNGADLSMHRGAVVNDSRFNANLNSGSGLVISGQGALSLKNVEAQGNAAHGILLNTTDAIVINGSFSTDNSGYGLVAYSSGGNLVLNNIRALGNIFGAVADNSSAVSAKTVTVNNSVFRSSSFGDGLDVRSKGAIMLNHIDAEDNTGTGVDLDNTGLDGVTYRGSGPVSLLNSLGLNQFIGNHGWPLSIRSRGAITVKGVYAHDNQAEIFLDGCAENPNPPYNCLGKGSLSLSALQVETTGNYGLTAKTTGAISLDGSSFTANRLGVNLDNASAASARPVTVTNSSFANTFDAASVGLEVLSKGSITLNNVQANNNQGKLTYGPAAEDVSGILLDNCLWDDVVTHVCKGSGTVSVLSSKGPSQASGGIQGDGLFIHSNGAVTVSGFSSTDNGGGAYINNVPGAGTLTITHSAFSANTGTQGGLRAYSASAVTLSRVEASQNSGGAGAAVDNSYGTTTAAAVTVSQSHFDQNQALGLYVLGRGNLTLNNVSANLNIMASSGGAILNSTNGGVTLLDTLGPNQFSFNGYSGLGVSANKGAISISSVTASFNGGGGISLVNVSAAATQTVTAQKILAAHNGGDGLAVRSKGSVTLNAVQANYNESGYGVNIDNCLNLGTGCFGSGDVSILSTHGPNSMSDNASGLWIESAGSVLVNSTTASNNTGSPFGGSGVWIQNSTIPGKTVTVNRGIFNYNHVTCMYVISA